jgi:hypothetical protein
MPCHGRWREHSHHWGWRPSANVRCVYFSHGSRRFVLCTRFGNSRFWTSRRNFGGRRRRHLLLIRLGRRGLGGGTATTGRATVGDGADEGATVGDGADEGATVGLSADTGLSGCGIIDIATNVRANPVGSAIQPAHPAAGMIRRRICRSRDLGRGSDAGDGASPCHSHKPASLLSALIKTVSVEGDIGASCGTATASLYAWPIDPCCSACMAHKSPLSCSATIPRAVRRPLDGLSAAPVSRLPSLVVARCIGERNHHRFEVRGRPRVLFVVEWHMRLASAPVTRLKGREDDRK